MDSPLPKQPPSSTPKCTVFLRGVVFKMSSRGSCGSQCGKTTTPFLNKPPSSAPKVTCFPCYRKPLANGDCLCDLDRGKYKGGTATERDCHRNINIVEFKNDYVLGFNRIVCEIFTVIITLQDWVGWGIFTVILGYPRRANSDSQHLEARPELQGRLRSEIFTVKDNRTGPFSK